MAAQALRILGDLQNCESRMGMTSLTPPCAAPETKGQVRTRRHATADRDIMMDLMLFVLNERGRSRSRCA